MEFAQLIKSLDGGRATTGWRRLIGCLKLPVIFRKRATNHRALYRKWPVKIRHPVTLRLLQQPKCREFEAQAAVDQTAAGFFSVFKSQLCSDFAQHVYCRADFWDDFSKVSSVVISYSKLSRELTFENSRRKLLEPTKPLQANDFSKVSSIVILYLKLKCDLTFENSRRKLQPTTLLLIVDNFSKVTCTVISYSQLCRELTCANSYIYTYIYVYIHKYIHTYTHTCDASWFVRIHIYIYICIYIYKYIHTYIHTCVASWLVRIHIYIYIYLYIYIHTYIHTHIHIHRWFLRATRRNRSRHLTNIGLFCTISFSS